MASIPGTVARLHPPVWRFPRVQIMDVYILRELTAPFIFSVSGFLLFWFINIFFLAADYLINAHAVLRFLLFRVPQCTPYAFPFACLLATLVGFGRLVSDNEITVLRTSGVSFYRICRLPLLLGVGMFALTYWINDSIAPKAVELSTRTFYQIVYHTAELPIVPQFFRKDDTTGRVFYVGNVEADHHTMDDVMIFEPAVYSPFRQVTSAEHAIIEGQTLALQDARVVRFKPDGAVDEYHSASQIQVGLPAGETANDFINSAPTDNFTMTSAQLKQQIKAMEINGQGGSALDVARISLAQKLSFPCASLISVILALPLAVRFGRKGRTIGIALAIFLLFAYYLLMSAFVALGKNEAMNPYLAAWIPNLIMGGASAVLFWQVEH
jgi:lipopolysaccharide export system permease protein